MTPIDPNRPFERLLAAFAHPDDEAFSSSGVFAALRDRGVEVTLVCATRGEAGEIRVPGVATRENLAEVREAELRRATAAVGVRDVRLLDYRDSGMIGTPENDDPRALMQVSEDELAGRIARVIRELRPAVVLTFGADGFYGHPDHLMVFRTTTAAALAEGGANDGWRTRALYYATMPRERFFEMARRPQSPFKDYSAEELGRMGTPLAEITTIVDVGPYVARKRAAIAAHQTQFGDGGPFRDVPPDEAVRLLSREHIIRVPLP